MYKSLRQWLRSSSLPGSWVTVPLVVKKKELFVNRPLYALIWKVFPEFHTETEFSSENINAKLIDEAAC